MRLSFLDHPPRLSALIACVEEAGRHIMQVYETDYEIEFKEDRSPVTLADKLSHRTLTRGLKDIHPLPILSEEGRSSWQERRNWREFWLVDPLDGTREFIRKNGQFTINLALISECRPVFGLLYRPTTKSLHYAARAHGAFKRTPTGWSRIRVRKASSQGYIAVCSLSHNNKRTESFLNCLKVHKRLKSGSALKFLRIAEGAAQLYPRLGPTSLWDAAAGQCIVEEAGGLVLDRALCPLRYNDRETTINPPFIACAQVDDGWSKVWRRA